MWPEDSHHRRAPGTARKDCPRPAPMTSGLREETDRGQPPRFQSSSGSNGELTAEDAAPGQQHCLGAQGPPRGRVWSEGGRRQGWWGRAGPVSGQYELGHRNRGSTA